MAQDATQTIRCAGSAAMDQRAEKIENTWPLVVSGYVAGQEPQQGNGLPSNKGNFRKGRYPQASFEVCAMQDLQIYQNGSFAFVYSSLTMHYALDWIPILTHVKRILTPAGRMLFSTHHPIKWGAMVTRGTTEDTIAMGYERPKAGMPTVHGDYLGSREVKDVWFGTHEVNYYHRPLGAIIKDISVAGLTLRTFLEPSPIPEAEAINPGFFAIHSKIPLFMIFELEAL